MKLIIIWMILLLATLSCSHPLKKRETVFYSSLGTTSTFEEIGEIAPCSWEGVKHDDKNFDFIPVQNDHLTYLDMCHHAACYRLSTTAKYSETIKINQTMQKSKICSWGLLYFLKINSIEQASLYFINPPKSTLRAEKTLRKLHVLIQKSCFAILTKRRGSCTLQDIFDINQLKLTPISKNTPPINLSNINL